MIRELKELGYVSPKKTLFPSILLIVSYPPKPSLGAHQAKTRSLALNPVFFFKFFPILWCCHHGSIMNLNIQNQVEDKSNLCLINLIRHWGGREGRDEHISEMNIHYFVLQYSMKDSWFLWPLFCNRVWYESRVFDLSTIIDKLGLHMVQSKM